MAEITHAACVEFKQAREMLSENQFHSVPQMVANKYWCVVFKRSGEISTIKTALNKKSADKLALALNTALGK
jgi:hypothetical protein